MIDRINYLARQRRYNQSEKGRARSRTYDHSSKGRKRTWRYETSVKGIDRRIRYDESRGRASLCDKAWLEDVRAYEESGSALPRHEWLMLHRPLPLLGPLDELTRLIDGAKR